MRDALTSDVGLANRLSKPCAIFPCSYRCAQWYVARVGQAELFAKRTCAFITEQVTDGAVSWLDPPEIGLEKIQADGFFIVHRAKRLLELAHPWPIAARHAEIVVEIKMAGDHVDVLEYERGLLRRQARQVQRIEERLPEQPYWFGQVPVWFVAPHVPEWLPAARGMIQVAQGCYEVKPSAFSAMWIAANELPLQPELVPFLVARSGKALDEFACWAAHRNPPAWVADMLKFVRMSPTVREDLLRQMAAKTEDPEIEARALQILNAYLAARPEVQLRIKNEGKNEGQLVEARKALRRVLACRGLHLDPTEDARIELCRDISMLERWHDQAVTASSTHEALT